MEHKKTINKDIDKRVENLTDSFMKRYFIFIV